MSGRGRGRPRTSARGGSNSTSRGAIARPQHRPAGRLVVRSEAQLAHLLQTYIANADTSAIQEVQSASDAGQLVARVTEIIAPQSTLRRLVPQPSEPCRLEDPQGRLVSHPDIGNLAFAHGAVELRTYSSMDLTDAHYQALLESRLLRGLSRDANTYSGAAGWLDHNRAVYGFLSTQATRFGRAFDVVEFWPRWQLYQTAALQGAQLQSMQAICDRLNSEGQPTLFQAIAILQHHLDDRQKRTLQHGWEHLRLQPTYCLLGNVDCVDHWKAARIETDPVPHNYRHGLLMLEGHASSSTIRFSAQSAYRGLCDIANAFILRHEGRNHPLQDHGPLHRGLETFRLILKKTCRLKPDDGSHTLTSCVLYDERDHQAAEVAYLQ